MKVERVDIDSIDLDQENAREHSQRNIDAIAGSLKKFGQRRPVVVWDGIVIAGNGTVQAAHALGWKQIEITRAPDDWTKHQARAYAIADNRTAELAEWNGSTLLLTLESLPEDLLLDTGFNETDLIDLSRTFTEPDLDALADQFPGDGDGVSELWPVLSVRVPPIIMSAWKEHLETYGGDAAPALGSLLGVVWDGPSG
jgi:hypothetical protein